MMIMKIHDLVNVEPSYFKRMELTMTRSLLILEQDYHVAVTQQVLFTDADCLNQPRCPTNTPCRPGIMLEKLFSPT